jgi:hypothetical protein
MSKTPWDLIIKVVEVAVDEAMEFIKEKLTNGGNYDSTGTGKTE